MRFTTQYISDMISCAKSKLAAASTVAWRREYYGLYGLTDSIWHIHQLKLYLFLMKRYRNVPNVTNASSEEDLSHIFDRIIRMPYPCDLVSQSVQTIATNQPPIVDAGPDKNLNSLVTSTTLAGSASDPDGDDITVLWTKVSGGNVTINSPTSLITSLTNMQPGVYVFLLTATDSKGATASDEITVTIAQATDTVYVGSSNTVFPGSGQEVYIQAGSIIQVNAALDVSVPWYTMTPTPKYCWVAIPNKGAAYNKNHWFVDIINQGNIGNSTDLIGAPITVSVNGSDYLVWETNYQTQFSLPCLLKKV